MLRDGEGVLADMLIFEPDAEGHAHEWLQYIVEYAAADRHRRSIALAAPERLCQALAASLPASIMGRVQLRPLSPDELRWCTQRRLWLAALSRWWAMRRHLRQSGARSGFFLSLDLLALPLAIGLRCGGKKMSGILFRPSVHYADFGHHQPRWRERIRDLRKDLFYRLMLRNSALSRVMSLDPFFPQYAARHYVNGCKVEYLPDPAHPVPVTRDPHCSLPQHRPLFLLFGHLTERKGLLVVLDALRLVRPEVAASIGVVFAGRVDAALHDRFADARQRLARVHPALWLSIEDRRLDDSELEILIQRSDVVLVPYQRFVGSSGVLLWAARAGRPVLAQDYGLVGKLTREHRLGLTVDTTRAVALADAITEMARRDPASFFDRATARAFAASQTPEHFATAVLGA